MKQLLYTLGIITVFNSCVPQHTMTFKELKSMNSNYQMSYDAMRRGSMISINEKGRIDKVLSEVQPDAAIATTREVTTRLMAKLKSGDSVSGENITKITETLSKLGERTAPVNMLRDALYRMEEHCVNFPDHCPKELYWKSFDSVVTSVTRLQQQISETARNEAEKAKQEKATVDKLSDLTQNEKKDFNELLKLLDNK
ncbi:hypothetical protein [uncultured Chryseobacterium sp.]|uniref:hypothetical protein n=1 Tax=uncultured Chryseobacterium sp. TaxID=259322 RepID=UPI0025F35E80|nr:hypothetical protein [uncultured Chryseobacterium sp.]